MYSDDIIQQFKHNGSRMNLQSFVNSAYFCKHKVLFSSVGQFIFSVTFDSLPIWKSVFIYI